LTEELARIYVSTLEELKKKGCMSFNVNGYDLVIFYHEGRVYALDNRCPHMGFPLSRGTTKDGILTCDWHHARFDLKSGGTFDLWAGDVPSFPTQVQNGKVWVKIGQHKDIGELHKQRLQEGLEQNNGLLIAKSVIALLSSGIEPAELIRIGIKHGITYRQDGWGQGLTILVCMVNLLPILSSEDRLRALFHGLSAVAQDCDGVAPRFAVKGLPDMAPDVVTLKGWFRHFIEVRDSDGAERCLVSAIQAKPKPDPLEIADILFSAATDHRYLDGGHILDFTNKAFEVLEVVGWDMAEGILSSLVPLYARATRMEERSSWRHPVDLSKILDRSFKEIPSSLELGRKKRGSWKVDKSFVDTLLGDKPDQIADILLNAIRNGATEQELAVCIEHASVLRIVYFGTSNEFSDWDTALHTYTFSHAVQRSLHRLSSVELLRAVFDVAMSVYLIRFLNVPPSPIPASAAQENTEEPDILAKKFLEVLDKRQQVSDAAEVVTRYVTSGGNQERLLAVLGNALLREDRNFHSIQMIEAAFGQWKSVLQTKVSLLDQSSILVAAARYLAAHSPTVRRQGQMFEIAFRLHRGAKLYEGIE
jgi:nitrite reductase/ring-hydroxylating ferredoxin subunit